MKTPFALLSCLLLAAAGVAASAAAPAEVAKPTHVITDYGAVPNAPNEAEQTRAIQTALNACRDAGGGTVVVPAGKFVSGSLQLFSNTTLRLEAGATLQASANLEVYQVWLPAGKSMESYLLQEKELERKYKPGYAFGWPGFPGGRTWLLAEKADNISIIGEGRIDLNGRAFLLDGVTLHLSDDLTAEDAEKLRPEERREAPLAMKRRPRWPMLFTGCRNVRLEGVRIVDSPNWTTRFSDCDEVSVRGVTIDNNLRVPNNDGLHFNSCRDVIVADCRISAGDDAIAFTGIANTGKWTDRVLVHHCILRSRSAAVRIGGAGGTLLRNVAVSDCLIYESNRGVLIASHRGGQMENVRVSRMTIETRKYGGRWWGQGETVIIWQRGKDSYLRGIVLDDLTCRGDQGVLLYSDQSHGLRDITLRNIDVQVNHAPVLPVERSVLELQGSKSKFERPLPAFLLEGADGVRIRDCRAGFDGEPRPAWATGPFDAINCSNVDGDVIPLVGSRQ